MADLSEHKPTERFSGLEDLYARHRPSYPAEAVDFIVQRCGLDRKTTLIDVGCGTGISTRLFAERGIPVIGIEPNASMRQKAESAALPPGALAPIYRAGTGESTGLPDQSAAAVLAAQAFHWFDAPGALREFHRILRPDSWVALVWNERDESDPCTADYGAIIRSWPYAATVEGPRARAGEALLASPLFTEGSLTTFTNTQTVGEDGMIGRALSASYAPRDAAAREATKEALRRVFAAHQRDGVAALRYATSVYVGRRR
jgi:SAM-dependent methyltransferase